MKRVGLYDPLWVLEKVAFKLFKNWLKKLNFIFFKFKIIILSCPIKNAICCEDHLHCCPSGYTCDVADGRCNKGDLSIPFLKKISASKVKETKEETVTCPGGAAECPDGTTCCQLSSGQWGWLLKIKINMKISFNEL